MTAAAFAHLFTIRGRQVLARKDHDSRGRLALVFTVWSDTTEGPVDVKMALPDQALPDSAVETWWTEMNRVFGELTAEKAEAALAQHGLWDMLDALEAG